jgi:hypothetical protein
MAKRRITLNRTLRSSHFSWLHMCGPRLLLHVQSNRAALAGTFLFDTGICHQPMGPFLYRCPNTGYRVQGWVADDESEDGERYEGVICYACGRLHLVNPKTGETAGDDK